MEYISLIANTGIQISDFKIKLNQENFRTLKFNYYEGLDSTYVPGIEKGERNVSITVIQKIADALKVDITELFR